MTDKITIYNDKGKEKEINEDDLCPWCKSAEATTTCGLCLDCNGRNF